MIGWKPGVSWGLHLDLDSLRHTGVCLFHIVVLHLTPVNHTVLSAHLKKLLETKLKSVAQWVPTVCQVESVIKVIIHRNWKHTVPAQCRVAVNMESMQLHTFPYSTEEPARSHDDMYWYVHRFTDVLTLLQFCPHGDDVEFNCSHRSSEPLSRCETRYLHRSASKLSQQHITQIFPIRLTVPAIWARRCYFGRAAFCEA